MKLTLFICNRCGATMNMDELPPGWQNVPGNFGTRPEKHHCSSCAANVMNYVRMDTKDMWSDFTDTTE